MPALKDIMAEMFKRRDTVPADFEGKLPAIQKNLVQLLINALGSLKTENNNLLADTENLAKVESISEALKEALFTGDYRKALEEFIKEFPAQAELTNKYFDKAFPELFEKEEKFYKDLVKNNQKRTLETLADTAIDANFLTPLKQQLTASITTGASFGQTVTTLTNFIQGTPEADGQLLRHVKQVARDGFSISDRQYTKAISDRLEIEWYLYQGGTVEDTRDFCRKHHGKYFHHKEVEKFASQDWQGKMKGTNKDTIFVTAGGYNCLHSWLPVSESVVPEEVIQRNITSGNIER